MSVAGLAREGRATELPGIGDTLQEKILALATTGTIPAAEKLRAKFPPGLVAITRLPGLGPKRARLLHSELGVDSPHALRDGGARPAPAHRARARPQARGSRARGARRARCQPRRGHVAAHRAAARDRDRRGARRGPRRSSAGRARTCSSPAPRAGSPTASRTSTSSPPPPGWAGRRSSRRAWPSSSRSSSVSSAGRAGARGAHALGRRRRPAHRQAPRSSATCCSTSPAPARTTPRCAKAPCAAGCTSPSTASSTTPPAPSATCPTEQEVYERLGLPYIEPELRENRGELEAARAGELPRLIELGGHPRRPAQPHGRLRRARHDRGDGARGARARLRVPGDHRPLRQPRLRQRRLARAAAPPDRARARGERARGRHRAAGGQRGQHPARRLARLRRRAARASSTG